MQSKPILQGTSQLEPRQNGWDIFQTKRQLDIEQTLHRTALSSIQPHPENGEGCVRFIQDDKVQRSKLSETLPSAKANNTRLSQRINDRLKETLMFSETAQLSFLQPVDAQYFFPRWSSTKSGSMKVLRSDELLRVRIRMEYWDETFVEIYVDDQTDIRREVGSNSVVLTFVGLDVTLDNSEEIRTFKVEFNSEKKADNFQLHFCNTRKCNGTNKQDEANASDDLDFSFTEKFRKRLSISEYSSRVEKATHQKVTKNRPYDESVSYSSDVKVGSCSIHEEFDSNGYLKLAHDSQHSEQLLSYGEDSHESKQLLYNKEDCQGTRQLLYDRVKSTDNIDTVMSQNIDTVRLAIVSALDADSMQ